MSDIDMIQRARDLAPLLEAAGDEIDQRRELPERIVAALIEGGFFRMLQPRFLGGAELRPVHLHAGDRGAGADQRIGRVVCRAEQRLLDVGGVSGSARSPARSSARRRAFWPGGRRARRSRRSRSTAAIASAAGGASPAAAIMRDGSARTCPSPGTGKVRTMLFPKSSVQMNDIWHTIGLRGTASNEYVVKDLFVPQRFSRWRATRRPSGASRGCCIVSPATSCIPAALPASDWGLRAAHQRFPQPARQQGVARGVASDAREQRGAVAACAMRGALALGARLPAHHLGAGVEPRRGHRRADRRGPGHDPPGLDLGDPAVARGRQHAVSCRRIDGGVRGAAVRAASARYPHGRAAVAGAAASL